MAFTNFGPEQQRKLLELSFEPHGDGYLYYRNRWSPGISVTAAERESYLTARPLESRAAFYAAIRKRGATAPPRKFGPVYWQMLLRMPLVMAGGAFFVGLMLAFGALNSAPLLVRALLVIVGIALVAFGLQIIYAKVALRRGL